MRIATFVILAVFAFATYAQRSPVEKAVKKYGEKKGIMVEVIDASSDEFKSMTQSKDNAVSKSMDQLDFIKIIRPDTLEISQKAVDRFLTNVRSALQDDSYARVFEVNDDDGEYVSMHVSQSGDGVFHEMALLIEEQDDFTMIYMKGDVDMNEFNFGDFLSVITGDKKKDEDHDDHEHDHDEPGGH